MYRSTKQNKTKQNKTTFLFTRSLRMLEPLLSLLCNSTTFRSYPKQLSCSACPVGQLINQRLRCPVPLVLGATSPQTTTPLSGRDRPVSRRSKPSSRSPLMGEQPHPWLLLQSQDGKSRHRGTKPRGR